MPKVQLVQCKLSGANQDTSIRYVPLEIYDLWKYMMEHRNGFTVIKEETSAWLAREEYESIEGSLPPHEQVSVTEVRFQYYAELNEGRQVIRYFPTDEYEETRKYFLAHFDPEKREQTIKEEEGFFLLIDE